MLKAECSAAAAYTLITSYLYAEGAGLNPLAAIEFRIQSAEKEIRKARALGGVRGTKIKEWCGIISVTANSEHATGRDV